MRAALYRRTGPSTDVLEVVDLETPQPGPGEVRVRVVTSGINPTDWKARTGDGRPVPRGFQVPHHDGAGLVDAVGAGVSGISVGERVWVYLAAFENQFGTAAEYCVVPATRVVPMPGPVGFDLGASLGVPAITAAHCLGGAPESLRGRTVLVAGGAGAVGHYAIELAKHAGATVVATASTPAKQSLARSAGADIVVDYRTPDAAQQILDSCGPVARIIEVDLTSNVGLDATVLEPSGTISVYGATDTAVVPVRSFIRLNATLEFVLLYELTERELHAGVTWITNALDDGALTALPIISHPLADIAAAHNAVEGGAVGKVVVQFPRPDVDPANGADGP